MLEQNKTKTIVTVGDGVAAWCLHYSLRNSGVKLINISAPAYFKACSRSSTAINCLRGTTPGNSPLGDTIIDSMEEFLKFNESEKPQGVFEGFEYQILEDKTIHKWERRYPEFHNVAENDFLTSLIKSKNLYHKVPAHFINVSEFEKWMKSKVQGVNYIEGFVDNIEQEGSGYLVSTNSQSIQADKVVLCTGSLTHLLSHNINENFKYFIDHSKPVTGGYLELRNASNLNFSWDESFVLAIEKYHFIYRKEEDAIQIGSTSKNNDALELPLNKMLEEIYKHIDTYTNFELPPFESFEMVTGVRHKGHLRRPFWGQVDDFELYAICGLYKNAFSFSFKAARDIGSALQGQ